MESKYQVPALVKADAVLQAIADEPNKLRLIDLAARLDIHKSSLYSLLLTMEWLNWVSKDESGAYALGSRIGRYGSLYASNNDLIAAFRREAVRTAEAIGETIQLARLEGRDVLYLDKREVASPVRLASDPGMKFPAHATALGKALLSGLPKQEREALYASAAQLDPLTPYSLTSREALLAEAEEAARRGFATDRQESVIGFYCVAAPVRHASGETIAAVSCSMPSHVWERKQDKAREEIMALAARLSG